MISAGWTLCRSRVSEEGNTAECHLVPHWSKEIHRHARCREAVGTSTGRASGPLTTVARQRRLSGAAARVDHPRWVAGIIGVLSAVVAGARVLVAGHRNVASFIVLGVDHVRGRVPAGVPITTGQGYDGQFYYRMALSPFNFHHSAHGIRMDTLSRFERITYPAFSWLVAGGRSFIVPWSLVIVNVIGLACLGALGATIARDARRHTWWGLLLPGYFGFVWVLSRDLAEIVTATFVVAGVLALRRDRTVLAACAFSVAVLSRETALVVVVLLALERPLSALWHRVVTGPGRFAPSPGPGAVDGGFAPAITWSLPIVVFVAWQLVVRLATGSWPLLTSGQRNLGVPFVGLLDGFRHYLGKLPTPSALLWFGELFILAVVVAAAILALRTSTARLYERAAWIAYGILAVTLAPGIWLGDVGFRSLDDLYVFSCIVLLSSRQRLTVPAVLVAGSWVVVAVELVRFI
jgi:hypothetical protein